MKPFAAHMSRVVRVAGFLLVVLNQSVAAQTADSRAALFARYRCPLADLLRQVFEAPSAYRERDRFLVLSAPLIQKNYVQCMFAVNRTKLFCEASSGYYDETPDRARRSFPSDAAKAAFEQLGFATGNEQKNYSYERDFTGTPDFSEIATLMLLAMHDGFGARAETRLTVTAPFAKKAPANCGLVG
jgi:hypothetical protein